MRPQHRHHAIAIVAAVFLLSFVAVAILASMSVVPVAHAATAHLASIPPCGVYVSGETVTAPDFSIVDLDQQHLCGGKSGRLGVAVTQDAAHPYTLAFDLSNMAPTTDPSFQAWVALRHISRYTKYSVHFFATHAEIRRRVNDVMAILASAPYVVPSHGVFAHVAIVESGYTISVTVDGALLMSATDTTDGISSGPSIVFYSDGITFVCWDNVSGEPILT